jgi:homoserine O-acetyltransferase/O-succinyltransferase
MLVKTQYLHTCNFAFECGTTLEQITLAYETFGQLNADKSNAVLVCHALTGDAHCAGKHTPEDKKDGWWDKFIGPNKAIDTNKFFVISSNVLGGCAGSTGPKSTNPQTQQVYGMNFPFVTIKDMVRGQAKILDELGIQKLHTCIGGSMGGMQALEWAITFPERCSTGNRAITTTRKRQTPGFRWHV